MPFRAFQRGGRRLLAVPLLLAAPAMAQQDAPSFVDATARAGIDFVHDTGARGDKHLPETMGGGVAWLDFDNDGTDDVYLVQSGPLPGDGAAPRGNVLFRNDGHGNFRSRAVGIEDAGYGMGAAAADFDGDGWVDVYVTNFGPNALYRNNGDGTFTRLQAGVEDPRWSASAAWGDLDLDGLADLFVTNYLLYDLATAPYCGRQDLGVRSYCHVDLFDGVADALFRNRGDGRFDDVAEAAGVAQAAEGKGLGVAMADLDRDGTTDIYVANDTQQNFLYLNRGDWRFVDEGLFSGAGYSDAGKAQAGMGVVIADLDGDAGDEILVTNFAFETNNLYRLLAPGSYLDETYLLGLGEPGLATLSFGISAFDADADGDLDVAVANGHILDNVSEVQDNAAYAQPNHLFVNRLTALRRAALDSGALAAGAAPAGPSGWRPRSDLLRESHAAAGPGFALVEVSRGLAVGDADGDGLADLAVVNSGQPARLLRNDTAGGERLVLRLRGRAANRDALGARVVVIPGVDGDASAVADGARGFAQLREVRSADSYCSQSSTDLHIGLGTSSHARVEIVWPGGESQVIERVEAGQRLVIVQGRPPVGTPLR